MLCNSLRFKAKAHRREGQVSVPKTGWESLKAGGVPVRDEFEAAHQRAKAIAKMLARRAAAVVEEGPVDQRYNPSAVVNG